MRELTTKERKFLRSLIKLSPQKYNGYMRFTRKKKHYKRGKVLLQLYLNKKLNHFDIVHHKDGDKTNDSIENLELTTQEKHNSHHKEVSKRKGHRAFNKISIEIEKEIYRLCEIHKHKSGLPHYEKIGEIVGLTGTTIRRYYLNKK